MSRKIAFYLENLAIPDVDLSQPELGNPGCGGTEFLFVAVPYYISKLSQGYEPILLANHIEKLPDQLAHIQVEDVVDAVRRAKEIGCAAFVYRPRRHTESALLALFDTIEMPSIAWAHITPVEEHMRMMAQTRYLKALVCVEHEQHDLAQDSAIWRKLTYIVNGFDVDGFRISNPPAKEPGSVVYTGSLVPQKGFHLLAKAWPRILQRHMRARLNVIGTGALYDNAAALGPWGVAERTYEQKHIIPWLAGEDGRPHHSVTFLGRLGIEKKDFLYRAVVGVVNPGGQTENCPGSALEFQACGTPVVSGRYYGLLDTVQHKKTGLLGFSEDELVMNICTLLENPAQAQTMGDNGVRFIQERYNFSAVVAAWLDLFESVNGCRRPKRKRFKDNLHRYQKYLIFFNRFFQVAIGRLVAWPSIVEMKIKTLKLLRAMGFKGA